MKHLAHIRVVGLFGLFDHEITLSDEPNPTILSGPNGSGKTHTLRLIKAIFDLDLRHLLNTPYDSLRLVFQKGEVLNVRRIAGKNGGVHALSFDGQSTRTKYESVHIGAKQINETTRGVRSKYFTSDFYNRFAEVLQSETGILQDSMEESFSEASNLIKSTWLQNLVKTEVVIIDTKRLHVRPPGADTKTPERGGMKKRSILEAHLDRIDALVAQSREASLKISQEIDQSFPMRILATDQGKARQRAASMTRLQKMYDDVHVLGAELHSNGLSTLPEFMEFPDRDLTALERRILTQFVQDWRKKFGPLLPVSERLKILREILNAKLRMKKVEYHSSRGLEFLSMAGDAIPVNALSSGEQHLVVLFTSLLFSARQGSIVLIDEPEISMHAAWQHAFLDDISRVAQIQDLQVILATHSTSIVNGNWNLVQEIGLR
ncbi:MULTISPECIES: AAA family ATPase [Streptomyces]|uniref:AAA family ATPase n=1 Tax=Streptomyces TaxID=1883 RepID=UPI002244BFA3|nr:AAA family ATPase [Streptomyces griseolus]MCW8220085.1 AAA family ATPase [Streptomyces griseolus]